MTNGDVARFLEGIADMLEIQGESTFKVRAYQNAAHQVEGLAEDINELVAQSRLHEVRGIGESIAQKITEYVTTGQSSYQSELASKLPAGLAEMLRIPGVGAKKALLFYEELHISTVDELEEAAKSHRLHTIPKIKEKTEQNILEGIQRFRQTTGRMLLGTALPVAEDIVKHLQSCQACEQVDMGGSIRRRKETIGDIDILVASSNPKDAVEAFTEMPNVKSILAKGSTKASVLTVQDLQVDLRVVSPDQWGAALQYFTGSKAHNIKLRSIAESRGLKVNEYGVFQVKTDEKVAGRTEEEVYGVLDMAWMPPEIRENGGEIEAAIAHSLPVLLEPSDIRGDLHAHTDWSDGRNTIEQMAEAAMARGYEYLAISDHSVGLGFVHGLTEERIHEQRQIIEELNKSYKGFRLLHGIEVNIRADGTLDYPDDVLKGFDVVVASVHSSLGQSKERMTDRMLSAIHSPHVDIIGHPSGRIINKREPSVFDEDAIFRAAAKTGTALEVNSQPDRLDLKDTHIRRATEAGALVAIDSDGHSTAHLQFLRYGVATARRGWVAKEQVLNALPLKDLLARLRHRTPG